MLKALPDIFSLKGKTALITGGAGYLGGEISDALAELGANIIVASRNIKSCQNKVEDIVGKFPEVAAHAVEIDLIKPASIVNAIDSCIEVAGGFDILVMCAWSGRKNTWESINDEDWDYDIEVCLNGVFRTIKRATPILKTKRGVILNIGSMYGQVAPDWRIYENVPHANPPSYSAAKAGVIQFTRYLASFLSPHGIRVNCISPGPFPFPSVVSEYPEFVDRLGKKTPMGRIGDPHEIKGAAALLCSNASSYMTGQNISVDGGWAVW